MGDERIGALIERLEKASGPDRELDYAIWFALHEAPPSEALGNISIPSLTASLDAALALCERVLPDWQIVSVTKGWRGPGRLFDHLPETLRTHYAKAQLEVAAVAEVRRSEHSYVSASGEAPTPALALCLALLRALSQKESSNA